MNDTYGILFKNILKSKLRLINQLNIDVIEDIIYRDTYHNKQIIPILIPNTPLEIHYFTQYKELYIIWRYACSIVPKEVLYKYSNARIPFNGLIEYDRDLCLLSKDDRVILGAWHTIQYGRQNKIISYNDTNIRILDRKFGEKYPVLTWVTAYIYGGRALDTLIWNAVNINILYRLEHQFFDITRLSGDYPWELLLFARTNSIFGYIYRYVGHLYNWNKLLMGAVYMNNELLFIKAIEAGAYVIPSDDIILCSESNYSEYHYHKDRINRENIEYIINKVLRCKSDMWLTTLLDNRFHINVILDLARQNNLTDIVNKLKN